MIAYIKGNLTAVRPASVIVEASGIGYEIFVPGRTAEELQVRTNTTVQLFTYMNVKEDGVALFGFLTEDALDVFKKLITVSGIGPKGALSILSVMSTDDLRFAVLSGDTKAIARTPGIGAKTAGKLILELKDKFKLEDAFESKWNHAQTELSPGPKNVRNEAIEALTSLGYSPSDAIRAVRAVSMTEDMTTEELLKLSLKQL